MNRKRKVAIIGTVYGLLAYLLYASEEDFKNTVFFLNKKYSSCAAALPTCISVENKEPLKNSFLHRLMTLFWGIGFRIRRAVVWRRYFAGAEIYAQDQFSFAAPLIGNSEYVLVSDGFNDFHCHITSDLYTISSTWCNNLTFKKRLLRLFFGPTWMGWFGLNGQCKGLLHENPMQIPYSPRKIELLKVDFQAEWNKASETKRKYICDAFNVTSDDVRMLSSKKVLLLAQPFEKNDLTDDELAGIYKEALKSFDPSDVVIKTHPLSTLDYKKYFPDFFVFEKNIPMQLLVLCGVENISCVITINSTAISMFSNDVTAVWLGTACHPKLAAHYENWPKDEVLFCPAAASEKKESKK